MKYREALEAIEKWLDEKKIRQHCRMECKGKCCINVCGEVICKRPPLPCAIFLCEGMRIKLFGFHNARNYQKNYLAVSSVIFGSTDWESARMGIVPEDIDIEIPDKWIEALTTLGYVPDDHGFGGGCPENKS